MMNLKKLIAAIAISAVLAMWAVALARPAFFWRRSIRKRQFPRRCPRR